MTKMISPIKLDLGGGYNPGPQGFIIVDITGFVDIAADFNEYLPFKSNSIDEIRCYHTIEHLRDLKFFMNECHRIMKAGSIMDIIVPRFPFPSSVADPDHCHFFNKDSFMIYSNRYWCRHNRYSWWGVVELKNDKDGSGHIIRCKMVPLEKGETLEVKQQMQIQTTVLDKEGLIL